jgi:hypothetical protein
MWATLCISSFPGPHPKGDTPKCLQTLPDVRGGNKLLHLRRQGPGQCVASLLTEPTWPPFPFEGLAGSFESISCELYIQCMPPGEVTGLTRSSQEVGKSDCQQPDHSKATDQ